MNWFVKVMTITALLLAGCAGKTPIETVESVIPFDNDLAYWAGSPLWLTMILGAALISPPPRLRSDPEEQKERMKKQLEEMKQARLAYLAKPPQERTYSECLDFCTNSHSIELCGINEAFTMCRGKDDMGACSNALQPLAIDAAEKCRTTTEQAYDRCVAEKCDNSPFPFKNEFE